MKKQHLWFFASLLLLAFLFSPLLAQASLEQARERRAQQQLVVDDLLRQHREQEAQCKRQWNASWCKETVLPKQRLEMQEAREKLANEKQAEREARAFAYNEQRSARFEDRSQRENLVAHQRERKLAEQQQRVQASAQRSSGRSPELIAASLAKHQRKLERHKLRLARLDEKQRAAKQASSKRIASAIPQ